MDWKATAGVDEAGRGCLAGPVVAAAVILRGPIAGLADSKQLSARKREALEAQIKESALAWSLGVVWPRRIDEINILQSAFEAMARAAACLKWRPRLLLIDGSLPVPAARLRAALPPGATLPEQKAIVKGDALEPSISAASILAKTFRDRLMLRLDRRWPGYGFAQHKGYGVKRHFAALAKLGPCPMHRLTFRGVRPDA